MLGSKSIVLSACLLLVAAIACRAGSSFPISEAGETALDCTQGEYAASDEPERVAARSGQIALDGAAGRFNFSFLLPAVWWVTEHFSADPSAEASGQIWNSEGPVIDYRTQSGLPELPTDVRRRQHVVTQECIAGVEAAVFEPAPDTTGAGHITGILFTDLPGTPEWVETAALTLSSLPGRPEVQHLVLDVARTVRWAPPPAPPEPPIPAVTPGPDWRRVDARTGLASTANFSLLLPPGWTVEETIGIDTLTGSIRGVGLEIFYDFGALAGSPRTAQAGIFHWQEHTGGETIHLFRPTGEPNHFEYAMPTGAYFPVLPGGTAGPESNPLFIAAADLDERQQEVVLSIFRTIIDAELPKRR